MIRPFYILTFLILAACAEGEPALPVELDMQSGTDLSKKDFANETDLGSKNDTTTFCTPFEKACEGVNTLKVCKADGSAFDTQSCIDPQVCENATCKAPQICTPGEKKCVDPGTLSTCRASGEAWSSTTCLAGQACVAGACVSGEPNGSTCAANEDCASKTCHCGIEEDCGYGQSGFCVTKGCGEGCESGFCFDGSRSFAGKITGYDFCLESCNKVCDDEEQSCHSLPSKDGFADGCYFSALNPIGGDCSEQADCVGDVCRRDYFRESNLCTRNCDAETPCPDGTGCVELDGIFQCTLLCGDGSAIGSDPCPLDLPVDRFDVTCKTTATADGGALRVCVTP